LEQQLGDGALDMRMCLKQREGIIVGQLPASEDIPGSTPASGAHRKAADAHSKVVPVPIRSLRPADSPRLNGEDKAHIARLVQTEAPLPPILVDRQTMRVIDGMHRLMAASLQGRESINVIFFDGTEAEVFLRAVQENVAHGLPLSQPDRRAAAERIIASHSHMSDRAIGEVTGLAAKTVATIRKRSADQGAQSSVRLGRDGKLRPIDTAEGRKRAADLLGKQSQISLRDAARLCGISPATVLDVRKRLERGDPPVPVRANTARADTDALASGEGASGPGAPASPGSPCPGGPLPETRDAAATVEKLLRDPSLRNNERGKGMLRLLQHNAVGTGQLPDIATALPPHCLTAVMGLAHLYAKMWHEFAEELDGRARIIGPALMFYVQLGMI
jgi:ParB-like chromosome segregation protein Spo0J